MIPPYRIAAAAFFGRMACRAGRAIWPLSYLIWPPAMPRCTQMTRPRTVPIDAARIDGAPIPRSIGRDDYVATPAPAIFYHRAAEITLHRGDMPLAMPLHQRDAAGCFARWRGGFRAARKERRRNRELFIIDAAISTIAKMRYVYSPPGRLPG